MARLPEENDCHRPEDAVSFMSLPKRGIRLTREEGAQEPKPHAGDGPSKRLRGRRDQGMMTSPARPFGGQPAMLLDENYASTTVIGY